MLKEPPLPDGVDPETLAGPYSVLFSRYQSNTDLQWRVPAFVLPVVIGSLAAGISVNSAAVQVVLAFVALLAGTVGALLMRRIEMTARWDRMLLDRYEKVILRDADALELLHGASFGERRHRYELPSQGQLKAFIDGAAMKFEPSASVFALMLVGGIVVFCLDLALAV